MELSKVIFTDKQTITTVIGLIPLPTLQYVFILFSLPQLYYFIWDTIIFINSENKNGQYKDFVRIWILLDSIVLISLIFSTFMVTKHNYNTILLIFSIICFGIIIADYSLNKQYYFKKKL